MSAGKVCQVVTYGCLIFSSFLIAVLGEWSSERFPNPQKEFEKCGHNFTKAGWLCDPDHILTTQEVHKLTTLIEEIVEGTSCGCSCNHGYRPAIAIVDKIAIVKKDNTKITPDLRLRETWSFARNLREDKWRMFGECGESLVTVASKTDKKVWTSVGSLVEKELSGDCIHRINEREKYALMNGKRIADSVIDMHQIYRDHMLRYNPCIGRWSLPWWMSLIILCLAVVFLFGLHILLKRACNYRLVGVSSRKQSKRRKSTRKLDNGSPSGSRRGKSRPPFSPLEDPKKAGADDTAGVPLTLDGDPHIISERARTSPVPGRSVDIL